MIRSLLLFPIFPRNAARTLQVRSVWWPAAIMLAAVAVLTRIIEWPLVTDAVLAHLPPSATAADRQWVQSTLAHELPLRCSVTPLISIGSVALFSGLLQIMGRAQRFTQRPRYAQVFALAAYAALIPAVVNLLTLVISGWTGTQAHAPSLAWFGGSWGAHEFIVTSLLEAVSVAALWYIVVLTAGLSVFFACSLRRSFLFVTAAWAVAVLTNLWLLRTVVEGLRLRV